MSFADNLENEILDELLGVGASILGATLEVMLSTTAINDDGTGFTEPAGFGYSSVLVDNDGAEWGPAVAGVKTNINTISFPQAVGGSWGTVTHWLIRDGGVVKIWGILDDGAGTAAPRTITAGDQFRFLADNLRITLD